MLPRLYCQSFDHNALLRLPSFFIFLFYLFNAFQRGFVISVLFIVPDVAYPAAVFFDLYVYVVKSFIFLLCMQYCLIVDLHGCLSISLYQPLPYICVLLSLLLQLSFRPFSCFHIITPCLAATCCRSCQSPLTRRCPCGGARISSLPPCVCATSPACVGVCLVPPCCSVIWPLCLRSVNGGITRCSRSYAATSAGVSSWCVLPHFLPLPVLPMPFDVSLLRSIPIPRSRCRRCFMLLCMFAAFLPLHLHLPCFALAAYRGVFVALSLPPYESSAGLYPLRHASYQRWRVPQRRRRPPASVCCAALPLLNIIALPACARVRCLLIAGSICYRVLSAFLMLPAFPRRRSCFCCYCRIMCCAANAATICICGDRIVPFRFFHVAAVLSLLPFALPVSQPHQCFALFSCSAYFSATMPFRVGPQLPPHS